jgi:MFS family permease
VSKSSRASGETRSPAPTGTKSQAPESQADRTPLSAPAEPTSDPDLLDAQQGRHRRPAERQASYREVFAVGEFRALWSAQVLSYAGDQFAQVAIAILVYDRTGSPFLTALAYTLTYLPPIIGGPLLSGLADLFPRRRIMIICDLIRAFLVAGMAVPRIPFAALCVLLFATVALGPPFSSARSAMLPDVLPGDKFVVGSAIGNITYQSSQIVGFVAGAAVVTLLDPSRTLALDALSFLLSALIVLTWVKNRPAPADEHNERLSLWAVARDGAVLVFGNPLLRSLVLFGWLAGFYVIPEGLAAPYARALGGDTFDVGLVMAAMPVGIVIGAFTIGRLTTPSTRLRLMGWLAMLSCAPLIGCAANPPLWVVIGLLVLVGIGGAYQLAAVAAFVQNVPDSGRARAFGLAQSGLLAAQGLGILIGGAVAQAIGPHLVVALAGLLGLACATLLAMGWTHRRAEMIANVRARSEAAQGG